MSALDWKFDSVARRINDLSRPEEKKLDSGETVMLAQQLEQMMARVFDVDYAPLKHRVILPINSEIDTGADSFSYEVDDYSGEANIIKNPGDDPQAVSVKSRKVLNNIVAIGDSFLLSIQELRAAAFAGKPIQTRKARAARDAFERKLEDIALFGAPEDGIPSGFANNADVTAANASNGNWLNATPTDILDDVCEAVDAMVADSKETEAPTAMILPVAQFRKIQCTRMSVDNPESVLEAILRGNPSITDIVAWDRLKGQGAGGTDRAVFARRSPDVMEMVMPQEFELLEPQPENYALKVLGHGRTAGCVVYRPLGMRYMDGISAP